MACYHPNKVFTVGVDEAGKKLTVFTSHKVQALWCYDPSFGFADPLSDFKVNKVDGVADEVLDRLEIFNDFVLVDRSTRRYWCLDWVHVPCGQCTGCRIDKSREWANRMVMEASYHRENCFITLTYDDAHVPISDSFVDADGVERHSYTLRKKDFQNFMKRLRKRVSVVDPSTGKVRDDTKIRFYACGEYGTRTLRPHYHAILFNFMPHDLKFERHDSRGYDFYTSELLSECWPYGFHLVSFVTWETCAYTARYVTKKLNGQAKDFYSTFKIEPEFSLMSRKPGIARDYFEDHKEDIYKLDKSSIIEFSTVKGGLTFKPPRYFDSLFDIENPYLMKDIRDQRMLIAKNIVDLKLAKTSLNYYELLEVEEAAFKSRIKALKRL